MLRTIRGVIDSPSPEPSSSSAAELARLRLLNGKLRKVCQELLKTCSHSPAATEAAAVLKESTEPAPALTTEADRDALAKRIADLESGVESLLSTIDSMRTQPEIDTDDPDEQEHWYGEFSVGSFTEDGMYCVQWPNLGIAAHEVRALLKPTPCITP